MKKLFIFLVLFFSFSNLAFAGAASAEKFPILQTALSDLQQYSWWNQYPQVKMTDFFIIESETEHKKVCEERKVAKQDCQSLIYSEAFVLDNKLPVYFKGYGINSNARPNWVIWNGVFNNSEAKSELSILMQSIILHELVHASGVKEERFAYQVELNFLTRYLLNPTEVGRTYIRITEQRVQEHNRKKT